MNTKTMPTLEMGYVPPSECMLIQWEKTHIRNNEAACPKCGEAAEMILGVLSNPCWAHTVKKDGTRTMPTHEEVMENGATANDFGIPDSEIELADKVARAVQNDIDDAADAMDANIIAKIIMIDWEDMNRLLPDGVKKAMQESFIQAVAQDKLSIDEAMTNLEGALIEHDEKERLEALDDFDMRHFERQGEEYEEI